jgi:hypothetical protein
LTRNLAGKKGRCANKERSEDNEAFHGIPQRSPIVIFGGLRADMDIRASGIVCFDNRQSPTVN